ncbi:MAG: UDP-N-acetylmuramoyl-L-alanine--D-glutamate ligase [Saprospiraceae bacterium]|nr:UDP-N-acetylmuramoyl-L-alanine--D-glutamate ligase [Saprospiraceae bacterium]
MQEKVVVLGAGESGVGAAILAQQKGFDVFVSDKGKIKAAFKAELENKGIPYEEGLHTEDRIFDAKEVIKSPGIPDKVPLIQALRGKGIPVISEIEFAARYTNAQLIGITGSNGKTTTSLLTYHLLKTAGLEVDIAGNVGYSFARKVALGPMKRYVLELSSFQLDGIRQFRSDISLLLNITPDHLDRYEYKMENYIASKFRIVMNQTASDVFVYFEDDPNITGKMASMTILPKGRAISLSQIQEDVITLGVHTFDLSNTRLRGKHNALNALFAVQVAKELGLSDEDIRKGLSTFVNVAHRLEVVTEKEGIEYINDSKATNVDAAYYALEAMKRPIVWIAGGTDKGNDYSPLMSLVKDRVKAIVMMGKDNSKLIEVFKDSKPWQEAGSAQEAVQKAQAFAKSGDVILLSPACASFDLFNNYEDRGEQFKQAVFQLTE